MNISLTIDDTAWGYALAQQKVDGVDPLARAAQYVTEYCQQCGNQLGLTPQAQLMAAIAPLTAAQVATLVPQAVALAPVAAQPAQVVGP
jgi:hypothetical protein